MSPGLCPSIIDTHQHVFWHGRDDTELVADMDTSGIGEAWLLTWEIAAHEDDARYHSILNPLRFRTDGSHPGIILEDLLIARDHFPTRFQIGYCPHPLQGDAATRLEAAVKMYDVRVCGEWKFRLPFDDPRCLEVFCAAGELGLPVVLHLDVPYLKSASGGLEYQPKWYGGTIANLERAMQSCPDTIFIGHAPGFWREISKDANERPEAYPEGPIGEPGALYRLFDSYPNLHADLSAQSGLLALRRDITHARDFLIRFSDRLLFARDFYGNELQSFLGTIDLPEECLAKICHLNARRLLQNPGDGSAIG